MQCDQCKAHNPDENNFCGRCGVRLLRHPIPSFAEPEKVTQTFAEPERVAQASSTGHALSTLGVDDVKRIDYIEREEPKSAVVVADPIKPPAYLEEEKIPAIPRSVMEPVATREAPIMKSPEAEREERTTISGPSFLGLTDSSASDETNYLLEDTGSRGGKAWLVLVILIAVLVGIAWWQRDAIQRAGFNIPFLHSESQAPASLPANNSGATSASASQSDKSSAVQADRFTTTDSSAATDEAKNAPAAKTSSPNAADTANTESSLSRQAQESKERQSTSEPAVEANQTNSAAPPDPHQNQLLLMGEKYLYGRGVTRSCEQAMVYFRAAADQNNAPAMSHLAALYNSGECVAQDPSQAYSWLQRAHDADPNNAWIERDLEIMRRQMAAK
jgi:Sel1 repeat